MTVDSFATYLARFNGYIVECKFDCKGIPHKIGLVLIDT